MAAHGPEDAKKLLASAEADRIGGYVVYQMNNWVQVMGDMEKLFTHWDEYGWHRVTFYGDLREPVKELAAALKLKFIEEA